MYQYLVELDRVVDGDTIDVWVDLGFSIRVHQRLRLIGIDAPETRTRDLAEKEKGLETKRYLEQRLTNLNGLQILVETQKTGKFGRYLSTVFLFDVETKTRIININEELLNLGLAEKYGR